MRRNSSRPLTVRTAAAAPKEQAKAAPAPKEQPKAAEAPKDAAPSAEAAAAARIEAQGNVVRELKAAKGDKNQVAVEVDKLKALKTEFKTAFGKEYVAPAAPAKAEVKNDEPKHEDAKSDECVLLPLAPHPTATGPRRIRGRPPRSSAAPSSRPARSAPRCHTRHLVTLVAAQAAEAAAREASEVDTAKHLYGTLPLMQSAVRTGWPAVRGDAD